MAYPVFRRFLKGLLASALLVPTAASANFFWKSPVLPGPPVHGDEPGIITALPGATPAELRAALVWNLRSGLNVAALQCQFDPTLLTRNQYNAILDQHRKELGDAYQVLSGYFKRMHPKAVKAAQDELDRYGTRTYSSFSAVGAQLTFCEDAAAVGQQALWAPKGQLYTVAENRMRELRNSLVLGGEQQFRFWVPPLGGNVPPLDDTCWDKKDQLKPSCYQLASN